MSDHAIFLGVDGGGTKTEFVCIDADDRVIARKTAGTTYHLQVGLHAVVETLTAGVNDVCGQLGISADDIGHTFFGLPAFGEDALVDTQLETACGGILGHERYDCGNDMICGWAGSLGGEDGINLVAGTGSIGYGERKGNAARVGGWGELFSDEGSAYWIAIQGLNAFTRMSDGRVSIGPMHGIIRSALSLSADLDICMRTMGASGIGRDDLAALARCVSEAADQGDLVARTILERAGEELAVMAGTLRSKLEYEEGEASMLSWSGGVLSNQSIVRERFKLSLPNFGVFELIDPRFSPATGAALHAKRRANVAPKQ